MCPYGHKPLSLDIINHGLLNSDTSSYIIHNKALLSLSAFVNVTKIAHYTHKSNMTASHSQNITLQTYCVYIKYT